MLVGSLDPAAGGDAVDVAAAGGRRPDAIGCAANYREAQVCNWAVARTMTSIRCAVSCRLTRVIPDLSVAGHQAAWYRLEVAKRRLVYTLLTLGLPLDGGREPRARRSPSSSSPTAPGGDRRC